MYTGAQFEKVHIHVLSTLVKGENVFITPGSFILTSMLIPATPPACCPSQQPPI